MRRPFAAAAAAAVLLTTAGTSSATAAEPSVHERADTLMNLPYEEFARAPHDPPFNWTTDGCSAPTGYAPYSTVFRPACVQHDFGYRNYGARWELKLDPTRATKDWIDDRFGTELHRVCENTYTYLLDRISCDNAAEAYYVAVRLGGDASFFG